MLFVIPTIDVEGVHGSRPFEELILGDIGHTERWGVYRQADLFKRYGVSATFFVDVYEYTMWGEERFRDLCRTLVDMNQDVQLHTHPGWRVDKRDATWLQDLRAAKSYLGPDKDLMAKLSYSEQRDVLAHGASLLHNWTGQRPIAHRSGGYSINQATLEALKDVGIPVDSSMNPAHSNSLVNWSNNTVLERDGVIELPITIMRYRLGYRFGKVNFSFGQRTVKTDLNAVSPNALLEYVETAATNNIKILVLFMHSYSFLNANTDFTKLTPNKAAFNALDGLLDILSKYESVRFMSCSEFYRAYRQNSRSFQGSDSIPEIDLSWSEAWRLGIKRISRGLR